MLSSTLPDDLRRRRLIVLGAVVVFFLIAFTTYAVLVHRSHSATAPATPDSRPHVGTSTNQPEPVVTELPSLRWSSDPMTFARDVAEALFEWDTATIISRTDHIEQLVAVADPTGESSPGLVADIDNYLPVQDAWVELARYETRQWLTVDSTATPTTWAEAERQAGDQLLPGTTAITIHGTRHRSGIWEGDPVASEHDVSFTIFMVCAPSYPTCHLLRLSILDKPLD